ncbi:glycosyltransferase family 4 protein [Candidatus Bathyarchaeota archaeon]|nr:glycosyltransferase family 4 protein [Candidatus Bathyarchaeota archaeon]
MRIAHVVPYFQPQLGFQEYYLAKEQTRLGHEVKVITSNRYGLPVRWVLGDKKLKTGESEEEGVRTQRLPIRFELGFSEDCVLSGLKESLRDYDPDIVHAHGVVTPTSVMTAAAKKELGFKLVADCHMDYDNQSTSLMGSAARYLWFHNPLSRKLFNGADGYIAVAESSRRWLNQQAGVDLDKIRLIPLGATVNLFRQDDKLREATRKELGVRDDEALLVYAGKYYEGKDLHVLLEAVNMMSERNRVKTLIIGKGPEEYQDRLKELSRRYGLGTMFLRFQPKERLSSFYNAADVGVWPGLDSITIIEAMAAGLPVVIPRTMRNQHYLDYDNGVFIRRGDTAQLAETLDTLVRDEPLRREMGQRGVRHVEENLSWKVITGKTFEYYEQILCEA